MVSNYGGIKPRSKTEVLAEALKSAIISAGVIYKIDRKSTTILFFFLY